jgi:hypothetical protein
MKHNNYKKPRPQFEYEYQPVDSKSFTSKQQELERGIKVLLDWPFGTSDYYVDRKAGIEILRTGNSITGRYSYQFNRLF